MVLSIDAFPEFKGFFFVWLCFFVCLVFCLFVAHDLSDLEVVSMYI